MMCQKQDNNLDGSKTAKVLHNGAKLEEGGWEHPI